jgi:hypothetical protein
MHFCTKRVPHADPCLTLYNSEILVSETKFLGIVFDSKVSFKPHIDYFKKCLKAMNLLCVVSNTDWGADNTTLQRLLQVFGSVKIRLWMCCIRLSV